MTKPPTVVVKFTKTGCFLLVDGLKIAKRGEPGTPQARTWVMIEPGWEAWYGPGLEYIEIRYNGTRVH